MFLHLSVSHSVHRGGVLPGQIPPGAGTLPGRYSPLTSTPLGRYPSGQVHLLAGTAPPPGRYYEIRSMSGRYAYYWNAFLFIFKLQVAEAISVDMYSFRLCSLRSKVRVENTPSLAFRNSPTTNLTE